MFHWDERRSRYSVDRKSEYPSRPVRSSYGHTMDVRVAENEQMSAHPDLVRSSMEQSAVLPVQSSIEQSRILLIDHFDELLS